MEIDFLIAKPITTSRHNISPIEVKSGQRYTLNSLRKCIAKYGSQLSTPYVLHDKDMKIEDGIVYLPLYMTPLLWIIWKKQLTYQELLTACNVFLGMAQSKESMETVLNVQSPCRKACLKIAQHDRKMNFKQDLRLITNHFYAIIIICQISIKDYLCKQQECNWLLETVNIVSF